MPSDAFPTRLRTVFTRVPRAYFGDGIPQSAGTRQSHPFTLGVYMGTHCLNIGRLLSRRCPKNRGRTIDSCSQFQVPTHLITIHESRGVKAPLTPPLSSTPRATTFATAAAVLRFPYQCVMPGITTARLLGTSVLCWTRHTTDVLHEITLRLLRCYMYIHYIGNT